MASIFHRLSFFFIFLHTSFSPSLSQSLTLSLHIIILRVLEMFLGFGFLYFTFYGFPLSVGCPSLRWIRSFLSCRSINRFNLGVYVCVCVCEQWQKFTQFHRLFYVYRFEKGRRSSGWDVTNMPMCVRECDREEEGVNMCGFAVVGTFLFFAWSRVFSLSCHVFVVVGVVCLWK